ncbi:response regulator [Alicyclobacillus fastidiosus]|uniref:Response regulator transcription factor n=1 Tax=Alicyclobacillus fastidiosus TaxID=392011 RepID=A0ABV5AE86_9BACL|nr:response regulator transcription factor [Alicyclobacillus fastidiosus]WEH09854.1 response regulator transcription factor [Alicyclobacillus fastidiosus]
MNRHKIRVAIVDDHPVVREGLRAFLQLADDIEVVGEAECGESAVRLLGNPHTPVDVAIMDLKMPGAFDGTEAIVQLRRLQPGLRILALTSFQDNETALAAVSAGAIGFLHKDVPPDLLLGGIRQAATGRMVLEANVWAAAQARRVHAEGARASGLSRQPAMESTAQTDGEGGIVDATGSNGKGESLTEREREVLQAMARGLSNKEIGALLGISEKTVKVHVSHILGKLDVLDRTQAVLLAAKLRLVSL